MAYMETLCAQVLTLPTLINAHPDNNRLMIEALSIEMQMSLSLLGKMQRQFCVALLS